MVQHKRRRKPNRNGSRQVLLATAGALFARHGFHQVSVDLIAKRAGVAKTALYHHFGNKEGLVIDFLESHIEDLKDSLIDAVRKHTGPRARLRAVFDWHTRWFRQPEFAGSVFLRATHEYTGKQDLIEELSRVQKRSLRHAVRVLLEACGVPSTRSDDLAHSMVCLLDGATVSATVLDEFDAADRAWRAAELLLDSEVDRERGAESANGACGAAC